MNTPIRKVLAIIVVLILVMATLPAGPVQAAPRADTIIDTDTTWTTDQTITEDVVITAHLTIESGVTVTFGCSDPLEENYSPEFLEIFIDVGGRLTADGVTFQGDGNAGCWAGIRIASEDDLTTISNSTIRDASEAIFVLRSSPKITNNEIYNLAGIDADPSEYDGSSTYGIRVYHTSGTTAPIIDGNTIYNLTAGAGIDGADGAFPGADGAKGGNGGNVYGIYVSGAASPIITNNTITDLYAGACGQGGDGAAGEAGPDAAAAGGNGITGSSGGDGGDGGNPGNVTGIGLYNADNPTVSGNTVARLYASDGCPGGNAGAGGNGGAGADGDASNPTGGSGGFGAAGGHGGRGSTDLYNLVTGISIIAPYNSGGDYPSYSPLEHNSISELYGSSGAAGGNGGNGGLGGAGGDGYVGAGSSAGAGGAGRTGGNGGIGGYGGYAGGVCGIYVLRVDVDIDSNTIDNLYSGDAGSSGNGGMGGAGGNGGTGGYESSSATYGNGGDGGSGGNGGRVETPGGAGFVGAIYVYGVPSQRIQVMNNDIWSVESGLGGDGGIPGSGGDGGDGGDVVDLGDAIGGDGGDGGNGGSGADGSDAGSSILVNISNITADVVHNTLVNALAPETGGLGSSAGLGGAAGAAGDGATPGASGDLGTNGSAGSGGGPGAAIAIFQSGSTNWFYVMNNILFCSTAASNSTGVSEEQANEINAVDHNLIYGWNTAASIAAGLGVDNLYLAPDFLSATDHHLVEGSPGIDAGDNFFTPSSDIEGASRPADGDGDAVAVATLGAYETVISLDWYYLPLAAR